jgi:hypothetical protein
MWYRVSAIVPNNQKLISEVPVWNIMQIVATSSGMEPNIV